MSRVPWGHEYLQLTWRKVENGQKTPFGCKSGLFVRGDERCFWASKSLTTILIVTVGPTTHTVHQCKITPHMRPVNVDGVIWIDFPFIETNYKHKKFGPNNSMYTREIWTDNSHCIIAVAKPDVILVGNIPDDYICSNKYAARQVYNWPKGAAFQMVQMPNNEHTLVLIGPTPYDLDKPIADVSVLVPNLAILFAESDAEHSAAEYSDYDGDAKLEQFLLRQFDRKMTIRKHQPAYISRQMMLEAARLRDRGACRSQPGHASLRTFVSAEWVKKNNPMEIRYKELHTQQWRMLRRAREIALDMATQHRRVDPKKFHEKALLDLQVAEIDLMESNIRHDVFHMANPTFDRLNHESLVELTTLERRVEECRNAERHAIETAELAARYAEELYNQSGYRFEIEQLQSQSDEITQQIEDYYQQIDDYTQQMQACTQQMQACTRQITKCTDFKRSHQQDCDRNRTIKKCTQQIEYFNQMISDTTTTIQKCVNQRFNIERKIARLLRT